MTTNFFKQVNNLNINGDLQIIISNEGDNNLTISVLLNNKECGDDAKNLIPPLILRGTCEELDNGFFEHISQPMQQTSDLLGSMEAYLKQLEFAKQQSAMEKEKTDKANKEKEAKDKKYNEAIQKAELLAKDEKYKVAWTALPKVSEYPDKAEDIRKKQSLYEPHFAPNLFND